MEDSCIYNYRQLNSEGNSCHLSFFVDLLIIGVTYLQVKKNSYPHECQSTRRGGKVKCVTKFWICEKVKDWVFEDPRVSAMEL